MCASIVTHPHTREASALTAREVVIGPLGLAGTLHVPAAASALVVFAHGSGSSRLSPRNMAVAEALNGQGMATLLFDLLTPDEEQNRANVFDIPLLAERLVDVVYWIEQQPELARLPLGLCGSSTGAAAALAPNSPSGRRASSGCCSIQCTTATNRSASRGISK